jgi:ABC-type transport system substrate-binding protein
MKRHLTVLLVFTLAFALLLPVSLAFAGAKKEEAPPEEKAAPAEKAPEPEKPKPKPEQVLIFGSGGDAVRLDPADVTDGLSIQRMDNIFEGLVEYKAGSTEIKPCLATSWSMSNDGTAITFNLRRGVKFHDGTDFNADAVVFSFARQYNPEHPYHQYGEWAYWGYMFYDVDRMEKIDDYTVKLVLKRPNASIMTSLAMFTTCIVSPSNAEKWGEDAFTHPAGTGPFKFEEWVKDDHITLVANENYWRERPKLDKVIFRVIPDPSARLLALEVGEVHGIEYPNPADFDRIRSNSDLVLRSEPGMTIGYMAMNTGYGYKDKNSNGKRDSNEKLEKTPGYHEPLTKQKVRQAIQYAINKKDIVDYIYKGTASVAKNGMPPFMLGYNDAVQDYPYDPEMSKKLLREAGYPNGFEVTLHVMPVSRPYMFDPPAIGEAIQSYLGAVGIKVNFYQVDWGTYLQETESGMHQMCLLGWTGDNGDPDNFLNVLYGPNAANIGAAGNYAFYSDPEAQEHLDAALLSYDTDERARHYGIVQDMLHDFSGWVYIAHSNQSLAFRKNVKGYVLHPTSRKFFYPVSLD